MFGDKYGKHGIYSPWKEQLQPNIERNEEYEILIEFQLRREKQKNSILEERLKNKEMFIEQMKKYQEELTLAFQRCQQQLNISKSQLESLRNLQLRDRIEQIAELKHQIMQLKAASIYPEKDKTRISFNSSSVPKTLRNHTQSKQIFQSYSATPNQINHIEDSNQETMTHEVQKNAQKIGNFLLHFLNMSQLYIETTEIKITRRLKFAWKWIKQVVKQWRLLKDKFSDLQSFKINLMRLCDLSERLTLNEILEEIKSKLS